MVNLHVTPFVFREINPKIETNKRYTQNVDAEKYATGYPINRYWTFDFIETIADYINFDEIKTILDLGSRDGHQSVEFRNWFPDAKIIAFEANPNQIEEIETVIKGYNIEVINKAIGNYNGVTKFFICDNNVGASSLLQVNNHPRSVQWPQKEIEIGMVRIDNWCEENNIKEVDILWVDVQGAEKMLFEGCGNMLDNVKAICTEVGVVHMYHNSTLKPELDAFLLEKGFVELKTFHMGFHLNVKTINDINGLGECDVTYINKKYLKTE